MSMFRLVCGVVIFDNQSWLVNLQRIMWS